MGRRKRNWVALSATGGIGLVDMDAVVGLGFMEDGQVEIVYESGSEMVIPGRGSGNPMELPAGVRDYLTAEEEIED